MFCMLNFLLGSVSLRSCRLAVLFAVKQPVRVFITLNSLKALRLIPFGKVDFLINVLIDPESSSTFRNFLLLKVLMVFDISVLAWVFSLPLILLFRIWLSKLGWSTWHLSMYPVKSCEIRVVWRFLSVNIIATDVVSEVLVPLSWHYMS